MDVSSREHEALRRDRDRAARRADKLTREASQLAEEVSELRADLRHVLSCPGDGCETCAAIRERERL